MDGGAEWATVRGILILSALGLCGCSGFPLVVEGGGYSPVAVQGLLIALGSLLLWSTWAQ